MDLNQIYLGDCLELMKEIPSSSVCLILTDPPWMVSEQVLLHRSVSPKYGKGWLATWDEFTSLEDYLAFTRNWVSQCFRVLKEGGSFISFFDLKKISYLAQIVEDNRGKVRQFLHWVKTNAVPSYSMHTFAPGVETALWATKGSKKYTFNTKLGYRENFIATPIPHDKIHPAQKPAPVLKLWILYLSNPNDVVLDPFCGSGIICSVAKQFNRQFIGIEKEETYYQGALELVERVTTDLFEGRIPEPAATAQGALWEA